jgi:hypothetical protein
MSTTKDNATYELENRESAVFEAIEDEERETDGASCTYWVRDDGREFITDPNGDVVNLARLTAYAEHGERIHEAQAHHKIPLLKIDAPGFIEPLSDGEHGRLHAQNPEPVEVDGFPMLELET